MPSLAEITVHWNVPRSSASAVSLIHAYSAAEANDVASEFHDFLTAIRGLLATGVIASFDPTVVLKDVATGTTTGTQPLAATANVIGNSAFGLVPNAAMMLLQYRTNDYVGGREIRGRTFIPGLSIGATTDGELSDTALSDVSAALATYVGSAAVPCVWSRKHGSVTPIESATVWRELAVLRRRRA